jgi:acyl CoA:acetate/3-ketoacid CoA transferase
MGVLQQYSCATMQNPPAPVGALKIKQAAKYLGGVSIISVRRLISRGLLKPNRALRHVLIPISELDRFLQDSR